ncbi:MAG: hypothetical protein ACRDZ7_14785 [Acidimicrobiia bacterium]
MSPPEGFSVEPIGHDHSRPEQGGLQHAIDGTPILDIKPVLGAPDQR